MPIEITNVGIKGPKGDTGQSGLPLLAVNAVPTKMITPVTTFTGLAVSDNGAGKVLLTGVGAHGLSAADAIGANLYVSSGTGWAVGSRHKIISLDADITGNKIGLDTPFTSQGVPSIALGAATVGAIQVPIPALGTNGMIRGSISYSFKQNANAKAVSVRCQSLIFAEETDLLNIKSYRLIFEVNNRGVTSSQVGLASGMKGGVGPSINDLKLAALDLSAPTSFGLALTFFPAEPITIEKYLFEAFV
ncbi:hypothetical protein [Nitrosomonas communis]|uniref:hypothetical protein n=1 Tax=Nitrosomonas communis TaxID=44574 RepID=UPI003D2D0482